MSTIDLPLRSSSNGMATGSRLRVLAITSQAPWPLDRGGHIRTFSLLKGIASSHHLTVVTHWPRNSNLQQIVENELGAHVIGVPSREESSTALAYRAACARLKKLPFVCYRKHFSPAMARLIRSRIASGAYDAVYMDHVDAWQYFSEVRELPILIDFHNVYSQMVSRIAEDVSGQWKSHYLRREAQFLEQIEMQVARHATSISAVSHSDATQLLAFGAKQVTVIPNGVDCDRFHKSSRRTNGPPTILFLGSLDWPPNVAAVEYLVKVVLPAIQGRVPDTRLLLVGRNPTSHVRQLSNAQGVELRANVDDVRTAFADSTILAVPLESGGGTRIKILEAFAAGVPVVSTPIGCEGINGVSDTHLIVAERSTFPQSAARLLEHCDVQSRLATEARRLVREHYDWRAISLQSSQLIHSTATTQSRSNTLRSNA